jgi:hypothetical protein
MSSAKILTDTNSVLRRKGNLRYYSIKETLSQELEENNQILGITNSELLRKSKIM